MAFIWSSEIETGNLQIDTEHKELIGAINRLLEACSQGKGRKELENTVNFLKDYTKTHFSHEEQLQKKFNYPDYPNHKQYHDTFVREVEEIASKLKQEGATILLVGQVNSKIGSWLINHIKSEDVKVARHIKSESEK